MSGTSVHAGRRTATTAQHDGQGRQRVTAQQSSTVPVGPRSDGEDRFPAGAQVLVRDEVRLVRNSVRTEHDGAKVDVVDVSDFVRDREAVFFTGLERTRKSLASLADPLLTTGRPLTRVLAVLVPDPEASAVPPSTI
ncbi:hypothetical protein ACFWOL_21370 [Streptomyces sp. NPDC058442]|uniref:hypothetical protein n=1 Tax=Streptomyces sp. NPDC058442 TaxID=3346503 RepID=UPI0036617837